MSHSVGSAFGSSVIGSTGVNLTGIVRFDPQILQVHVDLCLVNLGLRADDGTHP